MADGYISQIKAPDNKVYLLKDSEKTDEKVKQTSNTEDKEFPILFKNANNATEETAGVKYSGNITADATTTKPFTFNPSTGNLTVTQLKIGTKNDNMGLFPNLNNWNQIGASNLYWYRSYINNYYGSRSHVDNWDSGKNIGTAATSAAAATKGTVNFYNSAAANATQTKTLLEANANTNSNITITLPSSTGTLALTSQIPTNLNQLTNGPGYVTSSGITSVTIGATSPVQSSTSTAQTGSSANTTISLKDAYGDTKNPYGTKAKNLVLAGPSSGNNAAPTFRALVAADIPDLSWNKITSNKPTTLSGYGITDAASSSHSHTLKIGNESLSVNTSTQTWKLTDIQAGPQYHVGSTSNCTYVLVTINAENSWMLAFTLRLYQGYRATDIQISGYNYGNSHWYSPQAVILGDTNTTAKKVYFGYTANWKLWVAVDGSSYTGADVFGVTNGHTQVDWENMMTITKVSSLPGTTQTTATIYRPWYRDETVSIAASANSVAWTNVSGRPTNLNQFTNGPGYITGYTETDPTVPAWAKAASKPSYTASEVGALASTTKYAASSSAGGSATTVATTEDKTNELIITGISSTATTTLKYNTYLTTKAGQVTIAKGTAIDNTAFNNRLILYANQNNEHASKGFTATTSSWGIGFQRKWNNTTEGGVSAGIYAFGVTSWRAGLVFRVKTGTTAANAHDTNALILHDDGSATFANTVNATKFHVAHTAGGQQEFRVTYGSTIDMSFMVGTANENHGIYDSKKAEWVLVAGASNTWNLNGNADTATTATNLSAAPTIASGGTATVNLSANTAYTLTVGGKSIIFKTPADNNTATAQDNILDGSNSGTQITYAPYTAQQTKLSFDTSTTAPTRTDRLNLNGFLYATKYNVAGHVTLQYNTTDSSLEFVFA